ncbi:hypothetical protein scyTo_0012856, partial [Scyliorhinus torazame]|nr:hypothetical protein [Scyliorhinus torazame]
VYSPGDSQESMFEEVRPLLTSVLDGYNVCIMAYGQTGSGKTYTMFGPHSKENFSLSSEPQFDEGIIPKAARELYRLLSNKPLETHSVKVSIVEVYNNEIIDLLAKDNDGTVLGVKRDILTTVTGASKVPWLTYENVGSDWYSFERDFIYKSKLISIDSIGGDAKLLVIVCVSPAQKYTTESLQSLGFGTRARQVQKGHIRKKSPVIPENIGGRSSQNKSQGTQRSVSNFTSVQ